MQPAKNSIGLQKFPVRRNRAPLDERLGDSSGQLIAVSRVVLAIGGLVAIYLDPNQPSQGIYGYVFLGAYAIYAFALLLGSLWLPLRKTWEVAGHIIEVALVCIIIATTEGPSSPFFVYFTFILLSATLRWQWRGALFTGASLSVVLMLLSATQFITEIPNPEEFDRLLLRNLYLMVASVLFAFLGDQLTRSEKRLERLRLARDLHDGVLQTLTAARLKLHAVGTQAEHQGEGLLEIAELLKEEQNHIRGFVEENRSHQKFDQQTDKSDPIATLGSFVDSLKKLWNCTINLSVAVPTSEIPVAILEASKPILAEAVANAVVHGKSTQIAVEIAKVASALRITVTDNGLGLEDASGPYNHAQLATANIGPRSLRERVAALGGSLRLASSTKGVKLQITLPNSAGRP